MLKKIVVVLFLFISVQLNAQSDFPIQKNYPFVKYDKNELVFPGDKSAFETLFAKFDTLIMYGTNRINILQIGASHTQADVFTAQLRMRFQNMYPGLSAGRGYVFPYNLIKTNSPYNYKAFHTGEWAVCRNVERRTCELGLTGISATTYNDGATITIQMRKSSDNDYSFNYVKILHSTDESSFLLSIIPDSLLVTSNTNKKLGYTEFFLKDFVTEITIQVNKTELEQNSFVLYGIFLENTYPGIVFHPIGINGAGTYSYNKCSLFEKQLEAINPDWIIIALGTNDGYTSKFNSDIFRKNFRTLIQKIKSVNPNYAITIIVPNDDYYKRSYPNPSTAKQEKVIMELAKEEGCSVWDMYEIMGGYNSSALWLKYGLMKYDKIHFTRTGYQHLADLFFKSFIDSYGDFIYNK